MPLPRDGTALWATVAFARSYHYSDLALPARIQEHVRNLQRLEIASRDPILAAARRYADADEVNNRRRNFWSGLFQPTAETFWNKSSVELEALQIDLKTQQDLCHKIASEVATRRLILAEREMVTAGRSAPGSELISHQIKALEHFIKAAELDPVAWTALEKAAYLAEALGKTDDALSILSKLEKVDIPERNRVLALHRSAEILFKLGRSPDSIELVDARNKAQEAIGILPSVTSDPNQMKAIGRIFWLLGQIQAKRNKPVAARGAYNAAKNWLQNDATLIDKITADINDLPN